MKTYDVKYPIGIVVYSYINNIDIIMGVIDSFRIIESSEKVKIQYLLILEELTEIKPGVYKNFDWFDEEKIFLNENDIKLH